MLITTLLIGAVARHLWNWGRVKTALVVVPFAIVDAAFLAANVPKIPSGGWFALVIAIVLVVQMTTWRKGREIVADRIQRGHRPVAEVVADASNASRVPGVAVFLFKDPGMAPPALVNNLRHNHVLHETTLMVSIDTAESPRVPTSERAEVVRLDDGVFQVLLRYGFMEKIDVPVALEVLELDGQPLDTSEISYFIGRESIVAASLPGMHPWREQLFVLLNRGAASASRFFRLPADRVFEVGSYVEI
jgi:KUP system potassium uptake protein